MSEQTEHIQGATAATFGKVWLALLALTAVEVFLCYKQLPAIPMLTLLIGLSIVKAALIIAYFMHMKFERFSLFLTLFPVLIAFILLMLAFLPDVTTTVSTRPPA